MSVDYRTSEITEQISEDAARRLTERIRIAATNYTGAKAKVLQLVDEAKAGSAHIALGYKSWTAYLSDVLSDEPLRLARDERRELVGRLSAEGMSSRAIAPIVGVHDTTVQRDIESGAANAAPEPDVPKSDLAPRTTGRDGKTYTRPEPTKPRAKPRRPLIETSRHAGLDLISAVERIQRIFTDDRFAAEAEQVAPQLRNHLTSAIETCQGLLDRINE